MTLTFDLLTSGSVYSDRMPRIACLPGLMLIAQVVFLSELGHTLTDTQSLR